MESRKTACMIAAGFIGLGLVGAATSATSAPRPITVEGERIDPRTQRTVSYRDLNLAFRPDQKVLNGRIWSTASNLCFDLNGFDGRIECTRDAVNSTDEQVAAAIERAQLKLAGKPVGPAVAITMVIGAR